MIMIPQGIWKQLSYNPKTFDKSFFGYQVFHFKT
jgi:hypothetical protein